MGEVFAGRYEFVEPIGHGGMGTVWLVWDRRDKLHRAAKVLRQIDADTLLRFVREQATRIEHEHCVTPRSWAGEDDRVLFTMDLVRGGSVATLLGDYGALPPQWAAVLVDQLLVGLDAVHRAGVVHRDVKPANLLLEATGRGRPHLRLGDFGVALPVGEPRLTRAHVVVGTSGYQAPEQHLGADPDPRQDLWATGIVLAELLTGESPAAEPEVVLPDTAPPEVDAALWRLATQLAAPDPADRPATAAQARTLLAATGTMPAEDAVPDDAGLEIEVLDHVGDPSTSTSKGRRVPKPATALGLVTIVAGLGLLLAAVVLWR